VYDSEPALQPGRHRSAHGTTRRARGGRVVHGTRHGRCGCVRVGTLVTGGGCFGGMSSGWAQSEPLPAGPSRNRVSKPVPDAGDPCLLRARALASRRHPVTSLASARSCGQAPRFRSLTRFVRPACSQTRSLQGHHASGRQGRMRPSRTRMKPGRPSLGHCRAQGERRATQAQETMSKAPLHHHAHIPARL
jgi:hypothetical protein